MVAYDPNASRVANRNVDGLCTRDELMVEKQRALNVKSSQVKCIMNSTEFGDIRYKPNRYFKWGFGGCAYTGIES